MVSTTCQVSLLGVAAKFGQPALAQLRMQISNMLGPQFDSGRIQL